MLFGARRTRRRAARAQGRTQVRPGVRSSQRIAGAVREACTSVTSLFPMGPEALESRTLLAAHDPMIELRFDEPIGSTTVTDSAAAGGVETGEFAGDTLPEIQNTGPSPAGGNFVHFEGDGTFQGIGGRIDMADLLSPVLGKTSSLSFYIRTTQIGNADTWQAPGVTGAEQAGSTDDIFWGNLGPNGEARIQTGISPISDSGPINNGEWVRITQTRNATTGRTRTYVNGVFVSEALSDPGDIGAEFRAIGATTDLAGDITNITGYNYLNGDLDQVEIYIRELSPQDVVQLYGPPAAAPPPAPGVSAVADSPLQVTVNFTNVANETGYVVRRAATAGGPFTDVGATAADQTTFVDKTVAPATQYFYQVVAYNQAGESAPAGASVTTPPRSFDPVIVYNFNEGSGTHVEDTSPENNDNDGTFAGDVPPEFGTDTPSPAGGSYLHLNGDGLLQGSGGRVDADQLLTPILGETSSISFYIRTTQIGHADGWQAPGVTGVETAGNPNDIFFGNLDPDGRARIQAVNGAISASTPVNTGEWINVTHTRDSATGEVRTFVDGVLVSQAVSGIGQVTAEFRAIGATTTVAGDAKTVTGYNYLGADLDQVEIFDRVLTAQEVARRYGAPAAVVPAAPAPASAVSDNPTQVTVNFTSVPNAAGYAILRSISAGGPFGEIGVVGPDQTSFVDATVSPATQYFYQVVAFNRAGNSAPAPASVTTLGPLFNPVIVYTFNEGSGDTAANTGSGGATYEGTLTGDILPTFSTTGASPAGGSFLHFSTQPGTGTPSFFMNTGGRVESAELLNPILGGTSTLSYFVRTTQIGHNDTWRSPGVTGAEQAGGADDIFWGNLDAQGRARLQVGVSPISASTPVNTGQWVRVTHTRNATTGVIRTYVNGALVSEATSPTGQIGAEFRSIGATTDLAFDQTTVQGYNHLEGDLDQIEIFDRALSPEEVAQFYGAPSPNVHVTQVFVNGQGLTGQTSANGIAFRIAAGVDNTYGYAVPAGTAQTRYVPWSNGINSIAIRFDSDVQSSLGQGDLVVRGIEVPTYTITGFTYDPATRTGVWTLAVPATKDKVTLNLAAAGVTGLDGEWTNGADAYPSGDGTVGGDFNFRINVLRGDATGDGRVNALDLSFIKARLNRSATNPGTTGATYSPFADIVSDGTINAIDLSAARARLNDRVDGGPPPAVEALLLRVRNLSR